MPCSIWHHLHNIKKVKNTHGGVFGCFSRFLNCIDGTKSRKTSQDVNLSRRYKGNRRYRNLHETTVTELDQKADIT